MNSDKRFIFQLMEGPNYSISTSSSSTTVNDLNSSSNSSSTDDVETITTHQVMMICYCFL